MSQKGTAYLSWRRMRTRCRSGAYADRGITIEPRWNIFANFLADMGERPEGKTLGRKNNNGPYCKDNCEWQTAQEQALNRSTTPVYGSYIVKDHARWRVQTPGDLMAKTFSSLQEAIVYRDKRLQVTRTETKL
jgi:hypothetical protein